jgi:hypothetical protein
VSRPGIRSEVRPSVDTAIDPRPIVRTWGREDPRAMIIGRGCHGIYGLRAPKSCSSSRYFRAGVGSPGFSGGIHATRLVLQPTNTLIGNHRNKLIIFHWQATRYRLCCRPCLRPRKPENLLACGTCARRILNTHVC